MNCQYSFMFFYLKSGALYFHTCFDILHEKTNFKKQNTPKYKKKKNKKFKVISFFYLVAFQNPDKNVLDRKSNLMKGKKI